MVYNTRRRIFLPGDDIDAILEMEKIGIDKNDCIKNIHNYSQSTCLEALSPGKDLTGQAKILSFENELGKLTSGCERTFLSK